MVSAWHLCLKGRAEVCVIYLYPPILYRLSVLLIIAKELTKFQRFLSKMLWVRGRPVVCREVCFQHPCRGGLGLPHLSHKRALRLAFLRRKIDRDPVGFCCSCFSRPRGRLLVPSRRGVSQTHRKNRLTPCAPSGNG